MRKQHQRLPNLLGTFATLLALLCVAVVHDTSAPAAAGSGSKAVVLQTFQAGNVDLDLAIAECRSSECPIQVRLLKQGRVVDRVVLPVPSSWRRAKAEPVDEHWGADVGLKAWWTTTGVEGAHVSTVGRLLTVAPQTMGLLVSQRFGFHIPKRNHLVVLPGDGKLNVVWKAEEFPLPRHGKLSWPAEEDAEPTWSATHIVGDPEGGGQSIAYFRGFFESDQNEADRFEAARLSWHAASASFRESPLPTPATPLYLLNLGVYEDAAKARAAREADKSYCLSPYWILNAVSFAGLSGGKAVVGFVYTRRSLADAAARAVKECLPSATASVLEWTATP